MEEARRRKLEFGRAKFAYFRERKAKSDVAQSQKKTTKRKGSSVLTHDVPQEEHALMAQGCDVGKGIESKAEDTNFLETTTETEKSADLSIQHTMIDPAAEKVAIHSAAECSELDDKMCQTRIAELEKRLLEKQQAVERLTMQMDKLQEQLSQHRDSIQLQEITVQEQNGVIRKLTSCLRQTRKDWDDLQEEASCVADQIHGLQLQLYQVNEMLKSKNSGKKEVLEAQQQMSLFQNSLQEQNACLEMLHQRAHDLGVQLEYSQKVHEREHDREISELITKHKEEMEKLRVELNKEKLHLLHELQQQMAATHKAEIERTQLQSKTLHSLELEALRLSLNNLHTSRLELTQSNLRKEKETALVELREMLNDKRAQEVAILQSRHQLECEKIKEHCLKEKEDLTSKYRQELGTKFRNNR